MRRSVTVGLFVWMIGALAVVRAQTTFPPLSQHFAEDVSRRLPQTALSSTGRGWVTDLDADGRLDLAWPYGGGSPGFFWSRNLEAGGFAARVLWIDSLAPRGNGTQMVVADFNGDGRPDLALGRLGKSLPIPSIELIFNLGALQFTRATVGRIPAFREDVMSLCALDVDRDGDPDLVAGTSGSGVRVLINQGGAFTDETSLRMFGGTWYANRIVACDVNRDGWQDFLIAPGVNGIAKERVMVAVNTGTGRFVPEAALSGHAGYAWDIACGDTDGDGWPEIVVIREDYVQQMYSCSAQGFVDVSHRLPQSLMVPLATGVLVDVDHDGFLDLVVAEFSGGRGPRVVVNDRRGTLREAGILGGPPDGSGNEILVADFDGDGDADICDGRATSWFPLDYWMALFVGLPRQAYVPRSILRGGTWTLWFTTAPGHVVAPWLSAAVGPRQTLGALGDWFLDPASSVSLGLLPVNAQNFATLALPVPPAGLPLGLRIYTQALDLDPAVPSRSHVMGVGSGTVQ